MRIAQLVPLQEPIPPKNKNGLEFIVYYLTEELVKRGHEVTLFASGNSKTSAKLNSLFPLATTDDPNTAWPPYVYSLWNSFYCFSKNKEFDIIHSHLFGSEPLFFSYFTETPLVSTTHHPKKTTAPYRKNKEYYKHSKPIFDVLEDQYRIFVSDFQKKEFKNPKKSFTILNGIPIKDFSFSKTTSDYFAFLGYLNYEKGAHTAIQTAKKAKVKLKLAGNGTEEFLKKEIYPYLDKDIEYLGPITGTAKYNFLKNAKALLVPIQWEEPFGLVMPEAMACGTPVIAFNRAAVPEIIKDGETGFIVKNEKEMIEAIKKIDIIDRFACRKHVEKNFTIEKMVDGYEKIYEKIIKENKRK